MYSYVSNTFKPKQYVGPTWNNNKIKTHFIPQGKITNFSALEILQWNKESQPMWGHKEVSLFLLWSDSWVCCILYRFIFGHFQKWIVPWNSLRTTLLFLPLIAFSLRICEIRLWAHAQWPRENLLNVCAWRLVAQKWPDSAFMQVRRPYPYIPFTLYLCSSK